MSPATMPTGVERLLLLREVEDFLVHEVALLDRVDLSSWRELFSSDGYYWAPARPDQASPHEEISLFFDDRSIMAQRAQRLSQIRSHGAPPARTNHMVSNIALTGFDVDQAEYAVTARFHMAEYRLETEPRLFSGGYEYRLLREANGFKIAMKKATLLNCDAAFYPLMVPF